MTFFMFVTFIIEVSLEIMLKIFKKSYDLIMILISKYYRITE